MIVAAGLALVVVVAALVVVIFQYGVANPSPRSLRDAPRPEIPGEIVFTSSDHCLVRLAASGRDEPREICSPRIQGFYRLQWTGESSVTFESVGTPFVFDLITGELEALAPPDDDAIPWKAPEIAPSGATATIDREGRVIVSDHDETHEIADFEGPGWRIRVALWSPDSQWLALIYTPPRGDYYREELWILSRDGSVRGTLAKDLWGGMSLSWRIDGVGVTPDYTETGSESDLPATPLPVGR
ncbi:MAG: hypothetical protein ACE5EF_00255 [Dehalococcoidia bacterium]